MNTTPRKLNIGCGRDYLDGYINVDISPDVHPDMVCNITEGLPFVDHIFEEVRAHNVLTQILLADDFLRVMNELWRITSKDGVIIIRVPNAEHICAWQDPMDCRRFTDQSFTYMEHGHRRFEQYGKHYGFRPFKVTLIENNGIQMVFHLTPIK